MKSIFSKPKRKINDLNIYTPFAESVIKDNLAYKGTFYLYVVCKILGVFISYYLWKAIFLSSSKDVLGGFTRQEMITYIFMSFVCSNMVYISITTKIGNDVVDGSIAINLIKPINYKLKLLSESIGELVYKFIVPSLFMWIGLEIYRVGSLGLSVTSIKNVLPFLISSLFSFILYFLFEFCFGMLAFYSTYVWGMEIIKNSILSFLTGQLIPLTFFPGVIQRIFDFMPFSSMNYIPVMIYMGKITGRELLFSMGRQVLWILILELLSCILWRKVIRRISVMGG